MLRKSLKVKDNNLEDKMGKITNTFERANNDMKIIPESWGLVVSS